MEQIERHGDVIMYGDSACVNADAAYRLFRDDYNSSVGRVPWMRLNRLGCRKERVKGHRCYRERGCDDKVYAEGTADRVRVSLMGIAATGYCWSVEPDDIPDLELDAYADYLAWLFSDGEDRIKFIGRKNGSGRNSWNLRRREMRM